MRIYDTENERRKKRSMRKHYNEADVPKRHFTFCNSIRTQTFRETFVINYREASCFERTVLAECVRELRSLRNKRPSFFDVDLSQTVRFNIRVTILDKS